MKKYKFKTKMPDGNTLYYDFQASMPLKESKIFSLEPLKSELVKLNTVLSIRIDALIVKKNEEFITLFKKELSNNYTNINLNIDKNGIGYILDNEKNTTSIVFKEFLLNNFETTLIFKDKKLEKEANFDGDELLKEIIEYTLNQKMYM